MEVASTAKSRISLIYFRTNVCIFIDLRASASTDIGCLFLLIQHLLTPDNVQRPISDKQLQRLVNRIVCSLDDFLFSHHGKKHEYFQVYLKLYFARASSLVLLDSWRRLSSLQVIIIF